MSRELKYKIFGDNMLGRATGGAIAALGRLRDFGVRMFRNLSMAAAGAAAGIAFFGVKAVGSWLEKTKSLGEVRRALQATGQASKENQNYLRQLTDWLQTTANVSDDAGDAAVAYALRLGVAAGEMGDFMKVALSLSKVMGTDLTSAIRYLTRAENEGTNMLRRYGIQIDSTLSKEQQYAQLKQRMMTMYDQGLTAIDDTGSKFQNLKLRIADVNKEMGRNIVEGLKLDQVFDFLRNKAQRLIEALQQEDNPFSRWIQDVRRVAIEVAAIGQALADPERRGDTMQALGNLLNAMIMDAVSAAGSFLMRVAPTIGSMIGVAAKAAFDPFQERDIKQAAKELGVKMGMGSGAFGMIRGVSDEDEQSIRTRARGIRYERDLKNMGIDPSGMESSGSRTGDAWSILREAAKEQADAIEQALENVKVEIPEMPTAPGGDAFGGTGEPRDPGARRNISLADVFDVLQNRSGPSAEERHLMETLKINREQAGILQRIEENTRDPQGGMEA